MTGRVLVVGQGIAGAALAWQLLEVGVPVTVADGADVSSASRIAAGIMNPISGMRMTSSWRAAELIPASAAFFASVGASTGRELVEPVEIWRVLRDRADVERALGRRARGDFVLNDGGDVGSALGAICNAPFGAMKIRGAFRVRIAAFLDAVAARLRESEVPMLGSVDPRGLNADESGVTWRGTRFSCAILCQGAAGVGSIPGLTRVGGEIARLRIEGWPPGVILNAGTWFAPDEPGIVLAGSTHRPNKDPDPIEGETHLRAEATKWLRVNYSIESVSGACRAVMPDRVPVAGWLPGAGKIGVINGLGSRGAMLAPWLASQWSRHLTAGTGFDPEIAPARFQVKPLDPAG